MKQKTAGVSFPPDMRRWIEIERQKENRSMSNFVVNILDRERERRAKQ